MRCSDSQVVLDVFQKLSWKYFKLEEHVTIDSKSTDLKCACKLHACSFQALSQSYIRVQEGPRHIGKG